MYNDKTQYIFYNQVFGVLKGIIHVECLFRWILVIYKYYLLSFYSVVRKNKIIDKFQSESLLIMKAYYNQFFMWNISIWNEVILEKKPIWQPLKKRYNWFWLL